MPYGLSADQFNSALRVFATNPTLEQVILFGSRAKGTHKPGSDVDIALVGPELSFDDLLRLSSKLDELNQPWKFDLLLYNNVDADVAAHIKRVGKLIYEKQNATT